MAVQIRVLVIEDNPGDLRLIREALAESTDPLFAVESAERLADALVRIDQGGLDVVLTDLTLPDSNGLQTLRAIQRRAPHLPLVALTGLDDEQVALDAVGAGADEYLRKDSAGPRELLRSIRYAIQRRAQPVRRSADGTVIAIAGPKGGSGRTLIAINLAALLAETPDARVCLVDLDLQFGDIGLLLKTSGSASIADYARAFDAAAAAGLAPSGNLMEELAFKVGDSFEVLQAPHEPELGDLVKGRHVRALLDELRASQTAVVLDLSTHIDEANLEALERSDRIVLVVEPFITSVKNVRVLAALLSRLGIPLDRCLAVLNRVGVEGSMRVDQVQSALPMKIAAMLPNSPVVAARTSQDGVILAHAATDSSLYAGLEQLAAALTGATPTRRRRPGFVLRK